MKKLLVKTEQFKIRIEQKSVQSSGVASVFAFLAFEDIDFIIGKVIRNNDGE